MLQYDLLVMDEGQDIIKPIYLYCLDALLKGGFEKGKWVIFYDEKQNISGRLSNAFAISVMAFK